MSKIVDLIKEDMKDFDPKEIIDIELSLFGITIFCLSIDLHLKYFSLTFFGIGKSGYSLLYIAYCQYFPINNLELSLLFFPILTYGGKTK